MTQRVLFITLAFAVAISFGESQIKPPDHATTAGDAPSTRPVPESSDKAEAVRVLNQLATQFEALTPKRNEVGEQPTASH